jgi:F-type H+-transporting ATPase subunit gamma
MESVQSLKQRLGSIGSTRQITKSMQLISTTKVQKTSKRLNENRAFFHRSREMVSTLLRFAGSRTHPYRNPRAAGCTAVIVISSDRGLCGAYNVNVCKEAYAQIKAQPDAVCITLGVKVRDYLRRRKRRIEKSFRGTSETPFYEDAAEVAKIALELYNGGRVDKVLLTYTKYESMISQCPETIQLLPVCLREGEPEADPGHREMNYEPDADAIFDYVVPMHVKACIYGAMLEASASEQSARLMSMDAAQKNCGDMIDRLALQYNRLRQGTITQELTEITGGAQALHNKTEE